MRKRIKKLDGEIFLSLGKSEVKGVKGELGHGRKQETGRRSVAA